MADQFSLDIDVEALGRAKRAYKRISTALGTESTEVRRTPGRIGDDWTGRAATSVKGDMTTLAGLLDTFSTHFESARSALATLETKYEEALTELATLNTEWKAAQSAYDQAITDSTKAHEKSRKSLTEDGKPLTPFERLNLDEIKSHSQSTASTARTTEQNRITGEYETLVSGLRTATKACARKLADAVHVKVPHGVAVNLHDPANSAGAFAAVRDAAEEKLGETLHLVSDRDTRDDAAKLKDAEDLEQLLEYAGLNDEKSYEQLNALLDKYDGDPEFAGILAQQLDPQDVARALAALQNSPITRSDPEWDERYLTLLNKIGTAYGLASQLQGKWAMPEGRKTDFIEAITEKIEIYNAPKQYPGQNVVIAAVLTQGSWDAEFLADVTTEVIDFERKNLDNQRWGQYSHMPYGGRTAYGYSTDPVETLLTALANNRAAAQQVFTEGPTRNVTVDCAEQKVNETLAYLLMDRRTNDDGAAIMAALSLAAADLPGDSVPAQLREQLATIVAHGEEQVALMKAEAEANKKPWYVDAGHFVLDLAGLIPLVGEPADFINGSWYASDGDYVNAGLSYAGMIPLAGWAATGGKGIKGIKALMTPEAFAKLEKQLSAMEDAGATLELGVRNGDQIVKADFSSADELAKALKTPQPHTLYQFGDLVFETDNLGRLIVNGEGSMRRFMQLTTHVSPGTQLKWGGHTFKVADDGAIKATELAPWKNPNWAKGEAFNAENWHRYPLNEVTLSNGRVLDSYVPGKEIVERKARQYADLADPTTLKSDINLMTDHYTAKKVKPGDPDPPKITVGTGPATSKNFPDQTGQPLTGKLVLEIPPQSKPLDIKTLRYARTQGVVIRDTAGNIYTPNFPGGKAP